jgi:signal transduction histidine kinase
MDGPCFELSNLGHAQLAPLATSPMPVWLWSEDARRVLWANPLGAAVLGASSSAAISARQFDAADPVVAEMSKLAASLKADAPPRLERVRRLGEDERGLSCLCSQIMLGNGTCGILVAAREPIAPGLTLSERAHRLLAGCDEPVAAFSATGQLLCATQGAHGHLDGATSLAGLGAQTLAAAALSGGQAFGRIRGRRISMLRLGTEACIVLIVNFAPREEQKDFNAMQAQRAIGAYQQVLEPNSSCFPGSTVEPASQRNRPGGRQHPLRFVWHLDEHGRFTLNSDEFIAVLGASKSAVTARPWTEIVREFAIDPEGEIMRAFATQETWSGISVFWPIGERKDRITIELSGLPVFDRDRSFRGYRGFGVCRDIARLAGLATARPAWIVGSEPASSLEFDEPSASAIEGTAQNVVPFPSVTNELPSPALSAVEHMAFRELSRKLTQGLAAIGIEHHPRNASSRKPEHPLEEDRPRETAPDVRQILDRVPAGILIYRFTQPLYANPTFLQWSGHTNLESLIAAGGLDHIFIEPIAVATAGERHFVTLQLDYADNAAIKGELIDVDWEGDAAHALVTLGAQDRWREREQELIEARQLAESASSAKSDFLTRMSHEIRTPLNSIIGFSEVMMTEQFGSIDNERYREYVKDIHASGRHLLSLMDDLLDLSKIEAGKLPLSFSGLSLNDIVQQCTTLMQPQAMRERIIIRTALADVLPPVVADSRSVRQILLNLLSNALKFTGAGGQVIISTALKDDRVILRVRDTGMGMNEEEIGIALEPFRQVATTPRGGTGLGLPLTKAIAEANGAQFHLSSTPQQGTMVEITFPASNARPPA